MKQAFIAIYLGINLILGQALASPLEAPGMSQDPLQPGAPIGRGSSSDRPTNPTYPRTSAPSTSPSNNYPSNPGAGLINLNYECPLVDQQTHSDLIQTLDILERVIQSTPECKNNANLADAVKEQEKMRNAALELKRLWNDPEHISENLVSFDSELQTMVMGINFITETLNNNSLLNSRCGQQLMNTETALLAVSDLVTGIAPFAMFGAAAASSMKVAVPYVLGVVGLASVIKLFTQLSANKNFEMGRYEHRQTVLKATCEYNRVSSKVRYLQLAQSGQTEMITREINKINSFILSRKEEFGSTLDSLLLLRKDFFEKIDGIRLQLNEDLRSFKEIKKYLNNVLEDTMLCSLGMELIENHKKGLFPSTVDQNFKKLVEIGVRHNELGLGATSRNYEMALGELVKQSSGKYFGNQFIPCGQATQKFVHTIESLVRTTEEELMAQELLFEKKLSAEPSYREWYSQTSILEKDRETLSRVVATMQKSSQDRSVMSDSELHQRLEGLRGALFGSVGTWGERKSPVESWLEHTMNMHIRTIDYFYSSSEKLFRELKSLRLTKTPQNPPLREGRVSLLPESLLQKILYREDFDQNLIGVNLKAFPMGSDRQERVCRRLEEIWLNWSAAMDHLNAAKNFCETISRLIDSKTSRGIVKYCGEEDLKGGAPQGSSILFTETTLEEKGYKHLALLTSLKLHQLNCVGHSSRM